MADTKEYNTNQFSDEELAEIFTALSNYQLCIEDNRALQDMLTIYSNMDTINRKVIKKHNFWSGVHWGAHGVSVLVILLVLIL